MIIAQSTGTFKRFPKAHLFEVAIYKCHLKMTFVNAFLDFTQKANKIAMQATVATVYTVTEASRRSLFMQPNIAFKLQQVPNIFFSIIVQCHKVSCNVFSMAYFVTSAYIHHTHDGNEMLGKPERDRSRMQRTCDGRLFQTTTPAPETEAFKISGCLVHSTMRCSLELSVSTHKIQ